MSTKSTKVIWDNAYGKFIYYAEGGGLQQSRSQSPRSSVGGIVRLWENAEENRSL